MAKALKGTRTHENLKNAFAGESQANRRWPRCRRGSIGSARGPACAASVSEPLRALSPSSLEFATR